jgi:hypothetical protein
MGGADDRSAAALAAAAGVAAAVAPRALDEAGAAVLAVAKLRHQLHLHDGRHESELQGDEGAEGGGLAVGGLGSTEGTIGGDAGHRWVSSGCSRGVAQKRPQNPSECAMWGVFHVCGTLRTSTLFIPDITLDCKYKNVVQWRC